jgi:hypothetical protein
MEEWEAGQRAAEWMVAEIKEIAKNRFYRAIFTSGSLLEVQEPPAALDVAAQALEQLTRKSGVL